ncbi:MAG: diacylglycerol kinase family protein [Acutalibacteraceae bacterium]|nr:diacylglycerol kinase family protein [Acutalibacteraceae bacterium]
MKYYVLYNPLAKSGKCNDFINSIELPKNKEKIFCNLTENDNYKEYLSKLQKDDALVICGGDGTLNRFINSIDGVEIKNDIFYLAAGSGNDFLNDLGIECSNKPIKINDYIKNLPKVYIEDKTYNFINGIGYGIDGYCCEEVNRLKALGKKSSYTLAALKGFLYAFKPTNATVIVDGKEYRYSKVWLTPTMLGKFFGGGMMIAPIQDRNNKDGTLTVVVAHSMSKLKILTLFPSIFKGKHIKYKKYVDIHKGHNISVKFDIPTAMQIDGETVTGVKEYTVKTTKNLIKA